MKPLFLSFVATQRGRWPARRIFLAITSFLLIPALVSAQFGFPQVVYDPTQAVNVGRQIVNEVKANELSLQTLQQAIALYNTATLMYQQIQFNATHFTNKRVWLGIATQVAASTTPSIFGETSGWNQAVNAGIGIAGAYVNSTRLLVPAPFYSGYEVGQSDMSANIASVNVSDGMSPSAMLAIANSRLNQPLNDQALTALEQQSADGSDGANSEVQQLNIISSGVVLQNRQTENQNALLTAVAEQQILANKVTRDRLASAINFYSAQDLVTSSQPSAWGNSADTIMNW